MKRPPDPLPPPKADGLFDDLAPKITLPKPLEVAVGINDQVDAPRYLARRFNTGFTCEGCGNSWEQKFNLCPLCGSCGDTKRGLRKRKWK